MVHIDNCLEKQIINNTDYNTQLNKLNLVSENLNSNNKYYVLKKDTIIERRKFIERIFHSLYEIICDVGASSLSDILFIICRINIESYYRINHHIHLFNKLFLPVKCDIKPFIEDDKKEDIEIYDDIKFHKIIDKESFLLNIHGATMSLSVKKRNMLLCISGIFSKDPLNITKKLFKDKYTSFNLNLIPEYDRYFFKGYYNQLSLRDFIIYTNQQIKEIIEYKLKVVLKYKEVSISSLVKEFLNMSIEDQIEFLTLFLLHQKDNESQYMAYLLYDMISHESYLLKRQPLAEKVFNNLHWSVQCLFKIALKKIEKKNKEIIEFNEDELSYEKRIMLLKSSKSVKNKALEKYKEIVNKNGENSTKAQHYLDGLLKIPFGIYKKEDIIAFLDEFRNEFKILVNKDEKISSYEINKYLENYSNKIINVKQFNYTYLNKNFKISTIKATLQDINMNILDQKITSYENVKKNTLCKMIIEYFKNETNTQNRNMILKKFKFTNDDLYNHKFSILNIRWNDYKQKSKEYIKKIGNTLDSAVYSQNDAKREIKRTIAQWINGEMNGYVFGFEGPPGTGKTSLAKQGISKCLNDRPFAFIAMGGSSNGSTLEGHNYTYLGATWGKIVDILQESQCMNPIIYIDELDKISNTENGKEIIGILTHMTDPSQNDEFQDKYFSGIKLDLSKVLFIFSYNDYNKLDPILADRIHRVKFQNLKKNEKKYIVNNYFLPEFLKNVGMPKNSLQFGNKTIEFIIDNYTSESGIRTLKQKTFEIIREINLRMITNDSLTMNLPFTITNEVVEEIFSNKLKIIPKTISPVSHIGLVNGLYATTSGQGGITIIQIFKTHSDNKLSLMITGQQGDVMKESVKCAKTIAWNLLPKKLKKDINDDLDNSPWGLHIHCPEAAVPKDGPSAGAAITLAMVSLLTNVPIRNDVALTGEIDLNGEVHNIGGLEYKIDGGKNAGVKTICYPKTNSQDIDIIKKSNKELFNNIEIIGVSNIWEVLDICLEDHDFSFSRFY
tara:strand:+ start:1638 stop:4664 length:3027 start_codon:yes stop_codon:yes gene_type:complete